MTPRAWAQPLLSKLSRAVRPHARPRPARRQRPWARLGLEWLEARVVPNNARLLWVRGMNDPVQWVLPSNWIDFATGRPPASVDSTDTLVVDPNQMVGGTRGSDWGGTDNLPFVPLAGLEVGNGYSGTTTLNNDLTVTGSATLAGGTFEGPRAITIGSGASCTWSGSQLDVNVTLSSGSSTSITGAAIKFLTGNLTNSGLVVWSGTGSISMDGVLTNNEGATFDIQNDARLSTLFGGTARLINQGTLQKSTSGGPGTQTDIAVNFVENQGQLLVNVGTLVFDEDVRQTTATARTLLASGTTLDMSGNTFFLVAGTFFSGNATFKGTLSNGDPAIQGSGGVVHLGLSSGSPATLTVMGTYSQQPGNGRLYVEVANGATGLLQVQAPGGGVGGNANINGAAVTFHRDAGQSPSAGVRSFLTAGVINGVFGAFSSDPAGDSWVDPLTRKTVTFKAINVVGGTYQVTIG